MNATISETKLLDVLERMREAIALLDRQARLHYVNSAAERLLGKPRVELLGQLAWDVAGDSIGPALRNSFARVLAGEEVLILRSYFAQGRWHEIVAHLMRDDVVLFGRDITERLEAEALRRQSEERFRLLVDGVKDYAICLLDPKGQFVSWNAGSERVFGYRADEILGRDHGLLYPPEQAERPRRNLEGAVAKGHHEDGGWLVRKDGSRLLGECVIYSLYDELGQPSGFAAVTRDVTEHRQMEDKLRTSEERLRLATDAAEVGTWEYLAQTDEWIADARCLALFGLRPSDGTTRHTREDVLDRTHDADREQANRAWDVALATGDYRLEYRVTAVDGVEHWLESRGKALRDRAGAIVRMLGVCRDMTERHRYDEFRQLLPGIIAHDLRAPLSTIKMATVMIVKSMALPEKVTPYAEATLRSVQQITKMADQLLEFTQARFGGGLPLRRAPTDLAEVCGDSVLAARVSWPDCDVRFVVDGDARGFWDHTRLSEVAANLLGNAIKHGSPGRPIDLAVRGQADDVVLVVHNSGAPIPPALLPRLFDPFRRGERGAPTQRGQRGYGLGLYISREIVVAHGGTIGVCSSSHEGTTFTVRLPRGVPASAAASLSP